MRAAVLPVLGLWLCCQSVVGSDSTGSVVKLGHFNIDGSQISVSGFSSGGAMAMQVHVAHSSLFKGAASFGGVAYCCANQLSRENCILRPDQLDLARVLSDARRYEKDGVIDPLSNLNGSLVYLYHGVRDTFILPQATINAERFYEEFGASLRTEYGVPGGHVMPTLDYGGACTGNEPPHIGNCAYNGPFEALEYIYGPLNRTKTTHSITGKLLEFDQTDFRRKDDGLAESGYIFVPSNCTSLEKACRLHIFLHGCEQGSYSLGDSYARNVGFNEVADINDIIILYPQMAKKEKNPRGCWDYIGTTNEQYATKHAIQIQTLKEMVDHLTSTQTTVPGL